MAEKLDQTLTAVHRQPVPDPDPAARDALERRLLEHFDSRPARNLHRKETLAMSILRRSAVAGVVVVAVLIVARQAPAMITAVIGKHLSIEPPAGATLQDPGVLAEAIKNVLGADTEVQLWVEAKRERRVVQGAGAPQGEGEGEDEDAPDTGPAPPDQIRIDLRAFSPRAGDSDLAAAIRERVPAARDWTITEEPLTVRTRVRFIDKIAHDLFDSDLDPEALEVARRQLEDEIRAREGGDAQVDVQVEDGEPGKRKMMIRVKKEQVEPSGPLAP